MKTNGLNGEEISKMLGRKYHLGEPIKCHICNSDKYNHAVAAARGFGITTLALIVYVIYRGWL